MSETFERPRYAFTVNQLVADYRRLSGLSQNELAALSVELFEAGILDRSFTQSAIARWERDPETGDRRRRVEKLRDDSLDTLAVLLEHALQSAGYDGARADDLRLHLAHANNRYADLRKVSDFALHIDAIMAVWPAWLREIGQHMISEVVTGMDAILRRQVARQKASPHNKNE